MARPWDELARDRRCLWRAQLCGRSTTAPSPHLGGQARGTQAAFKMSKNIDATPRLFSPSSRGRKVAKFQWNGFRVSLKPMKRLGLALETFLRGQELGGGRLGWLRPRICHSHQSIKFGSLSRRLMC